MIEKSKIAKLLMLSEKEKMNTQPGKKFINIEIPNTSNWWMFGLMEVVEHKDN